MRVDRFVNARGETLGEHGDVHVHNDEVEVGCCYVHGEHMLFVDQNGNTGRAERRVSEGYDEAALGTAGRKRSWEVDTRRIVKMIGLGGLQGFLN